VLSATGEHKMTVERSVYDFSGVRIGTATADGVVRDDSGTRIGTANSDGMVVNFSIARIGTLERGGSRPGQGGPLASREEAAPQVAG
jgi:hypothetical protein